MVKSENKIKMKLPQSEMTITEVENWLMERAGEGLVLDEFENGNFLFSEKKYQYIKYKIIPRKEGINHTVRKEFEAKGYSRLAHQHNGYGSDFKINSIDYYILRCVDPDNTQEVYGDELNREYLLKIYRRHRNKYVWGFLGALSVVGMAYLNYSRIDSFEIYSILTSIYTFILTCIPSLLYIFSLFKIQEEKEEILNYEHEQPKLSVANPKTLGVSRGVLLAFYVILIANNIIYFGGKYFDSDIQNLEGKEGIVSLIDIEGDKEFMDETDGEYEDCFIGEYKSTFMVPIHYYMKNDFETLPQLDYNTDIKYVITYDKLSVTGITDIAYDRWLEDWYNKLYSKNNYSHTSSNRFDKISYYYVDSSEEEKKLNICLCNDNEFITIFYNGDKTALEIIDTLEKKLDGNKEEV